MDEQGVKTLIDGLVSDREATSRIRDEMNRYYSDIRLQNINQRRDLIRHITLIAATIVGIVVLVADKPVVQTYLLLGIGIQFLVIFLGISYLREHLDKDAKGLVEQQDSYNEALEEKLQLLDFYISLGDKITGQLVREYLEKLHSSNGAQKIQEETKRMIADRKNRMNQPLDYFLELIVFLFATASFFILISLLNYEIKFDLVIGIIVILIFLSFSNISTLIVSKMAMVFKSER